LRAVFSLLLPAAVRPLALKTRRNVNSAQVMFLLYHYFEAKEMYNAIRLFIAGYVWMTGFGNFSYYYIRKDFTPGRFAHMMWRLNFLVLFVCLVMDNDYMLYYICPMVRLPSRARCRSVCS
jgi:hypothetical protein